MAASRERAGPDELPAAMREARFARLRAQGPQPTPPPGIPPVSPPDPSRPPPITEPPPPIPIPRPEPPPRPIDDPRPAAALAEHQARSDQQSAGRLCSNSSARASSSEPSREPVARRPSHARPLSHVTGALAPSGTGL